MNMVLMAALKRRSQPQKQRRNFHLIADEFQNFVTESFSVLQSEARKYTVDVTVAHQFRDQLPDLLKGSTLNVGNFIIFRVSGRDAYSLASQFDNTPPAPDTRVEPVYQYYDYQGQNFLVDTGLNTGEGKLYQEVELPKRAYNDMEAEMANRLSILPDYQAWCRLIYDPRSRGEKDKTPILIERLIKTEDLYGQRDKDQIDAGKKIAATIRENSRTMGHYYKDVEEEINRRSFGEIRTDDVASAEEV